MGQELSALNFKTVVTENTLVKFEGCVNVPVLYSINLSFDLFFQYEKVDEYSKYTVKYEYIKPDAQSTRSLGLDSDFPELVREIYELDEELGQDDEGSGEAR